jgi:putative BNR repeat neuraminidase
MIPSNRLESFALTTIVLMLIALRASGDSEGESQRIIVFNNNGGWSWFESERVIFDSAVGRLLMSSVANGKGADGQHRGGDVDVVSYDIADGSLQRFTLCEQLQDDDHDSAALLVLPDGRYLAGYSKHAGDNRVRFRTSTKPHDIKTWGPDSSYLAAGPATYSNLHYLSRTNTIFNFYRDSGRGFDPNYLLSNAGNAPRFRYGGHLLTGPEGNGGNSDRPYLRYVGNGVDRIHFITTNHHPRNLVSNGVYHGYIAVDKGHYWLCRSDGERLGELSPRDTSPYGASDFTPLMLGDTVSPINGLRMTRCWATDIKLNADGSPCVIFTTRVDDQDTDHRFFYGRFTSGSWSIHELARAGGYLYAAENDYTGLAAIDPKNPSRVFISTNVDPQTRTQLPHYEIFEGVTYEGGSSWNWKSVTRQSTVDNIRPVASRALGNRTALIWMRGTYSAYTAYDMSIVGIPDLKPTQVSQRLSTKDTTKLPTK